MIVLCFLDVLIRAPNLPRSTARVWSIMVLLRHMYRRNLFTSDGCILVGGIGPVVTQDLASNRVGTRVLVASRDGPPEAHLDAGVAGLVGTRQANKLAAGSVHATTSTRYANLCATNIELRTADVLGCVEANMLNSEEILSALQAARELNGNSLLAIAVPHEASGSYTWMLLPDLEPLRLGRVEGCGGAGSFCYVESEGARVLDVGVCLEADGGASPHGEGAGSLISRLELIAAHLDRRHGRHWAV